MKKYALNPNELYETIMITIFYMILLAAILVMSLVEKIDSISAFLIFLCFISFLIISIIAFALRYIRKYSGYFYIQDNQLFVVKNRKKRVIKIEDIKFIELKYHLRKRLKRGVSDKTHLFEFLIKLKSDKTFIPYLITNSALYEILELYGVRFLPEYLLKTLKKTVKNQVV